jgi:hypothetical protein
MDCLKRNIDQGLEECCGHRLAGFLDQVLEGEPAGAVDGQEEIELAFGSLHLASLPAKWNHFADKESRQTNSLKHVLIAKPSHTLVGHAPGSGDMEVTDGTGPEFLIQGLVSFHFWQSSDMVSLSATMQRYVYQPWDCCLQCPKQSSNDRRVWRQKTAMNASS